MRPDTWLLLQAGLANVAFGARLSEIVPVKLFQ